MTTFYNMLVCKYIYLKIRRNGAGTNNKVKILLKTALAQDVSKWLVQSKSTFSVSLKSAKWVAIDGAKIQESSIRVCQTECCKDIWNWKDCPQLKCEHRYSAKLDQEQINQ